MRKITFVRLAVMTLAAASVSACGAFDGILGSKKKGPDEFSVVAQQPLAIPPNADLRPPQPGAPRPQDTPAADQAKRIVTGTGPGQGGGGSAEQALLAKAGADKADPNVRTQVNVETRRLNDNDQSFIDRLVFWRDRDPSGTVVDPQKEQDRLRQGQATGQSPDTGGPTPTIERRRRGILEGIF